MRGAKVAEKRKVCLNFDSGRSLPETMEFSFRNKYIYQVINLLLESMHVGGRKETG
jgi:hypothetical protein